MVQLLLVPITINYLNSTNYGIWVTLTSLIAWFGFFDIGLGNGLRNRFAEAIAKNDHELAKTYVSTTYAIIVIIISIVLILFYCINNFLDWSVILNTGTDPDLRRELSLLAIIVFTSFGFNFVLKLISVILNADQRPAQASLFDLIGKTLALMLIYILTRVSEGSLLLFGFVYCCVSPAVLAISTIWFFNGKYRPYSPSLKWIDFSKAGDLLNLGIRFFLIQIAAVILFQTNNIIISQIFGPAMVTPYNVAFKYFSVIMMGFMIIIGPFWSAFTEAWTIKDIDWVSRIMNKLMKFWILVLAGGIAMLLLSRIAFRIWIGNDFSVPKSISILTLAWILLNAWNGIFSQFLNGIGKIKLQLYLGMTAALINIPLAVFLGKFLGIAGVLLANVFLGTITAFIGPIQYRKIITFSAKGIWNK